MFKSKISKDNLWTQYFLGLLLLSFYYLSYRYPLKFNSSDTSFSYSDTPPIFQAGKYAVFAGISYIFFALLINFKDKTMLTKGITKNKWVEIFLAIYIFTISISSFLVSKNDYVLQTGIFFSTLILFYLYPYQNLNYKKIVVCIRIFIYLSIITEAYQLFNYYVNDRLPALGYPNSISVRFGSIWDDPNAFAMIVSFLLAFIIKDNVSKVTKIILSCSMLTVLFYTLSLTGIGAFLLSFPLGYFILFLIDNKIIYLRKLLKIFLYAILIIIIYKFIVEPSTFFQEYMSSKQDSIAARKSGFSYFNEFGSMLGLNTNPLGKYSETSYINLLLNFGIFYLIAYIFICFTSIYRLAKIIKVYKEHVYIQIFYAAFFFMITFMLGMANSPLDTVFPLNLMLVICIILSYTKNLPNSITKKPKNILT
ncbi:hypothetical protein ABWU59_19315 [Priestia megaterium]|uniref:hypothetical protein n=1 Tax=Priestia megaterium TaxID=1404 RepID=UPI0033975E8C